MTSLKAERYLEPSPAQLQPCLLTDLSELPRVGFRGADSAEYLRALGYRLPEHPNQAVRQADGSWVARLSQTEYLLLAGGAEGGARIASEEARWVQNAQRNYLLPRQDSHAWLQLSGNDCSAVMAKLCGVDLRAQAFALGAVAQTSAARINVIVVNVGDEDLPVLWILFDRASREYFNAAVLDAMDEFGGRMVEVDALHLA
ncbi:sarcosine oxidase [Pseudomonas sp. BP8]|uniref:sarcosine oxidase n=1 Tax=Pseudomonas sp. BP8 TaxID=2817864 RepID=UPI001AE6949E|nr:sarcosine oxidase [Pseudomonas sp. BP8]MBP2262853.1 sarcosine oxidase subunit gamma [Pseudomonas sp. BP8]HDS1735633.1 sarcosine oxidase [Pseudomonas putida]